MNRGNVAYEYDQINIICPMYSKGTREDDIETYIIYNVSLDSLNLGVWLGDIVDTAPF